MRRWYNSSRSCGQAAAVGFGADQIAEHRDGRVEVSFFDQYFDPLLRPVHVLWIEAEEGVHFRQGRVQIALSSATAPGGGRAEPWIPAAGESIVPGRPPLNRYRLFCKCSSTRPRIQLDRLAAVLDGLAVACQGLLDFVALLEVDLVQAR